MSQSISKFQIKKIQKKNDKLKSLNDKLKSLNTNFKYVIILDFEANCSNSNPPVGLEIIEFPCVVYNLETNTIDRTLDFSYFCKINTPLTKFCTELTSITQQMSDSGDTLKNTLKLHQQWMIVNNFIDNSLFVTCGDWDLKTALPTNAKLLNLDYASYLKKWCNIKIIYEEFYKEKPYGMKNMLEKLNINLEGTHHRGIDDCANIAKICKKIVDSGYHLRVTNFI
jgi:inhibitor of KinA sporulation pathway (predicted exonuclease)